MRCIWTTNDIARVAMSTPYSFRNSRITVGGRRLPVGGAEEVADVADRLDPLARVHEVAQLAPQAIDATVDRAVRAVVVEAAQAVEDVVARQDLAGMAREQPEEVEFRAREVDGLARQARRARGHVDLEAPER